MEKTSIKISKNEKQKLESIFLSEEEIIELEKELLLSAKEYELDKSDDELIYRA